MTSFELHLDCAPEDLRPALLWFHSMTGLEIPWPSPSPVEGIPHLVTKAKGIYKPSEYDVALSVRQTITSPYSDRIPVTRGDGTWYYIYHQEGVDPSTRDSDFANVALLNNISIGSPVAVLIQTVSKSNIRYLVRGLAVVTHWQDGYFILEGFNESGNLHAEGTESADLVVRAEAERVVENETSIDVDPAFDGRLRATASIVRRQGQGSFRRGILRLYQSRCVISHSNVVDILDAAHIRPYRGAHTNSLDNGLLLRTDLHTLMDLGLIAFDPRERTVIIAVSLNDTEYAVLNGTKLEEPIDEKFRPTYETLKLHLDSCGDRLFAAKTQMAWSPPSREPDRKAPVRR